jgi:hypothetical protein
MGRRYFPPLLSLPLNPGVLAAIRKGRGKQIDKLLKKNRVDLFCYNFAFSFRYVEVTACDMTLVSDNTGMKLASPCHLGTI